MVPLRYPLEAQGSKTLQRAIHLTEEHADAQLYFLHVNLVHQNEHVRKNEFREAIEREIGSQESATYDIQNAFLLEEAILQEAVNQDADYVVIGKDTRSWWRRILTRRLGMDIGLEVFLQKHLGTKLIVI